jgi:hypothetical protein
VANITGTDGQLRRNTQQFSEEAIKDVVKAERSLTPKAATFWALVYHIPLEDIAALKN